MADTELVQINKGIKRLVTLIETSTIVDRTAVAEAKKTREFQERERDEKGRFIKKEKEIQDKKGDTAEKEAGFIVSAFRQLREKNKKEWEAFKEQSRLYKLGQAFWKSEAGMAIRNFFSRIKGIFSNIMGEIGEFFGNMWATLKDSFSFVKGTFKSIVDAFQGGPAKERREKEVAKNVKEIKQTVKREERRGILGVGKKGGKGSILADLLHFLGLSFIAGGGGLWSIISGFLQSLLFKWIPWLAIFKSVYTGIKTWLEGGTFLESVKAALMDLLSIPKWLIGTILSASDFFFGTDLRAKFDQGWKDFEKRIEEMIDFLFVTIPKAFGAAWERLKAFDIAGAYEAFKTTLQGGDYVKRSDREALEQMKKEEAAWAKGGEIKEKIKNVQKLGMEDEEILDMIVSGINKDKEKAKEQRDTQINQLERIANALEGNQAKPGDAPSFPNTTGTGQPTIAPNVNNQLQSLTAGP